MSRNMIFKKALSDLLGRPGRSILVLAALVIGIWGSGTILVSHAILNHDLDANFQMTRPPHAIMRSDDLSGLNLAELRAQAEIQGAELRNRSIHRIEVYPNKWIPLILNSVDRFDTQTVARFFPEQGALTSSEGSLLIERNGRHVSNLDIGSSTRIRIGNTLKKISISGIVFDPAQAPATQDALIYAYTDPTNYKKLTGDNAEQRLLLRFTEASSKAEAEQKTQSIFDQFRSSGVNVESFSVSNFNEHPHQWQLNTLLFLVGSIGLLAFVMSAVLVSQLMKAIMNQHVRQIGILKAIGATRFQVARIYVFMLLILGISAGVIAVPLAIGTGFWFSHFVANILNFEILTTRLPLYVYATLGLASLLSPLVFSLAALRRGCKCPVREALADYGISSRSPSNVGILSLSTSKFRPTAFTLAARNAIRSRGRLGVTVLSMALGVGIFTTGFNVRQSLENLLSDAKESLRYDVQVVLEGQTDREEALAPFQSLKNIERIETWAGGRASINNMGLSTSNRVTVVALPFDTQLQKLRIDKGRWIARGHELEVVLNQSAQTAYSNPSIGDKIALSIGGQTESALVVGIAKEFAEAKAYVDQAKFDSIFNTRRKIESLLFQASDKDYEKVIALKRDIEAAIEPSKLKVLYVMSQAERVKIIYDHLNIILSTIIILSFLVLLVSAIGMGSAMGINIMERTREIGVMRAVGATPRMIYQIFVSEGMLVSSCSVALGLPIGLLISKFAAIVFGDLMLGEGYPLQFAISGSGLLITVATTLAFGWISSRFPARKALAVTTREALDYE